MSQLEKHNGHMTCLSAYPTSMSAFSRKMLQLFLQAVDSPGLAFTLDL